MSIGQNYFWFTGRIGRATFISRMIILIVLSVIWVVVAFFLGFVALLMKFSHGAHMDPVKTGYIFGLIVASPIIWSSWALMLQRVRDLGVNPMFFFGGMVVLLSFDRFVLSEIPELVIHRFGDAGTSWIALAFNLMILVALIALPSGFFGEPGSSGATDAGAGPSWADTVVIPTTPAETPRNVLPARSAMVAATQPRSASRGQFGTRAGPQRR